MHPTIQKALEHLQNAHYAGYFEEMDTPQIVPAQLLHTYNMHKAMFISTQYPFNFHQTLEVFAKEADRLMGSNITEPTNENTDKDSNITNITAKNVFYGGTFNQPTFE